MRCSVCFEKAKEVEGGDREERYRKAVAVKRCVVGRQIRFQYARKVIQVALYVKLRGLCGGGGAVAGGDIRGEERGSRRVGGHCAVAKCRNAGAIIL